MALDFRDIPEKDGCGVYAIINAYDLTVYVGCTRHLRRRAQSHRERLKKDKHPNKKLQESAKEGILRFVVLEELPEDVSDWMMREKELLYIRDFCKRPKYNVCNREAGNVENLEHNILFNIIYFWDIERNVNKTFKKTYDTEPWNMVARSQKRRMV